MVPVLVQSTTLTDTDTRRSRRIGHGRPMAMEQSRRLLKAESARDKGKPPSAGRGRHESCVRPNNSGKSNVPLFFPFLSSSFVHARCKCPLVVYDQVQRHLR